MWYKPLNSRQPEPKPEGKATKVFRQILTVPALIGIYTLLILVGAVEKFCKKIKEKKHA